MARHIIDHEATGHAAKEDEGGDVTLQPRLLIEAADDPNEEVAAVGEDEDEGPEAYPALGLRIEPGAEIAEVDLGLLTRRWVVTTDGDCPRPVAIGPGVAEVAVEGGQTDGEELLVVQALPDRAGAVAQECLGNQVVKGAMRSKTGS